MANVAKKSWTYDELIAAGLDPEEYEIVAGEPVEVAPMGFDDGSVFLRMAAALGRYLDANPDLGTGTLEGRFLLCAEPRLERRPDLAVVLQSRVPVDPTPIGLFEGPPDLAVEIVSPSDQAGHIRGKADEYLEAGTREVWIVDPGLETVTILRPDRPSRGLGADGGILESDLLPEFSLPLTDLFIRRGEGRQ